MMTADDLRALLRCDRDAKETRAEWERQSAEPHVMAGPWPGCAGELTPREQAMLGLLRALAKGPEYRPGLPTVDQVRAHEARGGTWHACYRGGRALMGNMRVQDNRGLPSVIYAGFPGTDALNLDDYHTVIHDGWGFRPCLPDGTPCGWGEGDPWSALEALR